MTERRDGSAANGRDNLRGSTALAAPCWKQHPILSEGMLGTPMLCDRPVDHEGRHERHLTAPATTVFWGGDDA